MLLTGYNFNQKRERPKKSLFEDLFHLGFVFKLEVGTITSISLVSHSETLLGKPEA
jgi:hypothetical protein